MQTVAKKFGIDRRCGADRGILRRPRGRNPRCAIRSASAAHLGPSLLGRATGLSLPSLGSIPQRYSFFDPDVRVFDLLRNLAKLGVVRSSPRDARGRGLNPCQFAAQEIASWLQDSGASKIIDRMVSYCLSIGTRRGWEDREIASDRLLLEIDASSCGYMAVGKTVYELESRVTGLGCAFYRVLIRSVNRKLFVYDHESARFNVERLKDMIVDEEDEQEYEVPDVEGAMPAFLRARMAEADLDETGPADLQLITAHVDDHALADGLREILSRVLRIHELSEQPGFAGTHGEDIDDDYYDAIALPSLLVVFAQHDAIEGCFDEESQTWGECTPQPNLGICFRPEDFEEVSQAIKTVSLFMEFNRETFALAEQLNAAAGLHGY